MSFFNKPFDRYIDPWHSVFCFGHFDGINLSTVSTKIVSEYDQEIPQSQTGDKPMAPRGRATQQSPDTRKANQAKQPALSSHQDDCKT